MLKKSLKLRGVNEDLLLSLGLNIHSRPQELSLESWVALVNSIDN